MIFWEGSLAQLDLSGNTLLLLIGVGNLPIHARSRHKRVLKNNRSTPVPTQRCTFSVRMLMLSRGCIDYGTMGW